ncbi:coiled-coil domain-containing protein 169 isoform X1 [Rhipicephalus sanguineus]|uniref:coiled-coil domain-containing protein 169 isoform X1 n=1 Tax=Rhipicephalus sanguineus TaxID=34632 RepID=UPI001895C39B|nr:coiled-coil domain-containing protein 169 isoform X1 [Rhipicephalus sanguineus]
MRLSPEIDAEIKRLKSEIENEEKMKHMLEQSINDLCKTVEALEVQSQSADVSDEDEWKVRYYTQVEVNEQLEHQRDWLRSRAEAARVNNKEGLTEYLADLDLDSLTENQLVRYLKQLEKDRNSVYNEIRDTEWKLDQESKAFHKFNDTRKAYMTEITDAMLNLESLRNRIKIVDMTDPNLLLGKCPRHLKYLRTSRSNIQPDQRIIDPRKGPIRKTAAVRSLPKLASPDSSPQDDNAEQAASSSPQE